MHFIRSQPDNRQLPTPAPAVQQQCSSTQTDTLGSHAMTSMMCTLHSLPSQERAAAVGTLMQSLASPELNVPSDFVELSLASMKRLKNFGRSNILYGIASALGTMRPDGSDSRMPVSRMPVGLIEYVASFFSADSMQKVHVQVYI